MSVGSFRSSILILVGTLCVFSLFWSVYFLALNHPYSDEPHLQVATITTTKNISLDRDGNGDGDHSDGNGDIFGFRTYWNSPRSFTSIDSSATRHFEESLGEDNLAEADADRNIVVKLDISKNKIKTENKSDKQMMNKSSTSATEAGGEDGGGGVTPTTKTPIPHKNSLYHHTSIKKTGGNIRPKGHLPHPHAGARYPNRTYGYVADVTAVRKRHFQMLHEWEIAKKITNANTTATATVTSSSHGNSSGIGTDQEETFSFASHLMQLHTNKEEYNYICNTTIGAGYEGSNGWKVIQKVKVAQEENILTLAKTQQIPRVLCSVYTFQQHHGTLLQSVVDTWAWKCDGFLAASTVTDIKLGAVDLPHVGQEEYDNMWHKVRSIWGYIHDNYLEDYDYFWLGGDDVLLIVENLKKFLVELDNDVQKSHRGTGPKLKYRKNINRPDSKGALFLGSQVTIDANKSDYYCHGGPGYILNKSALKRLILEVLPTCQIHTKSPSEDRILSSCFRKIGITCGDTTDLKGRQRFIGKHPQSITEGKAELASSFWNESYKRWKKKHGLKSGTHIISEDLTGYHGFKFDKFLRRIHVLTYPGTCPSNTLMLGDYNN